MRTRFKFGALLTALLAVGFVCGSAHGQAARPDWQTLAQQRRAARQAQRQARLGGKQPRAINPNGARPAANANPNANNDRPGPNANVERPGVNANNLPPKAIERLQEMPPDKQEKFLQNNQRFQNLPPDQQTQIRQRLQAWNHLNPSQQQDLRDRQQVWEQLTPEQRTYVRQTVLPRWQQLPPPRRQAIMQRLHSLRDMSETDRQAKLNDPAFMEGMSGEDRETLKQLAHLHVGMAADTPGM
jgi:Protein of unknown function (DUF3106)